MSWDDNIQKQFEKHEKANREVIDLMKKKALENKEDIYQTILITAEVKANSFKRDYIEQKCKENNIHRESDTDKILRALVKEME